MLYPIYRFATAAAEGLFERLLRRRLTAGKEDPARLDERRGIASRPRPPGYLIWLHAASVGEANSLLPLIDALRARKPDATLLVTTGTKTSAALMVQRLPPSVIHQYVPLDAPAWVQRFFDHWQPQLGILVESELWPNLLADTKRRGVTMALLNGRLSERSAARWRALRPLAKSMLESFALVGAQSPEDAARYEAIGASRVRVFGNLKFAGAKLPVDLENEAALARAIGERKVWLFASTHAGEEEIAERMHRALSRHAPDLLTIIAPRHPERAGAILEMLSRGGWSAHMRSNGNLPQPSDAFYLADTLGELGTLFSRTKIVVMGGSFASVGGHNPLEPAASGCAVIAGPHMENFAAIAARMTQADALLRVETEAALIETLRGLLGDADRVTAIGENGRRMIGTQAAVLSEMLEALEPLFTARGNPQ